MSRMMIDDHVWSKLAPILKSLRIHYSEIKTRLFIEAILYRMRVGCQWRDLPKEFGKWPSIFSKFNRWSERGYWRIVFENLKEVDSEWVFIDSTTCKAHKQASNIKNKKQEAIGKSVGGNTTKIHALCDSNGNMADFILTGGNVHDSKATPELIKNLEAEYFIADRAYHSKAIRAELESKNIQAVIPIKSNSKNKENIGFDSYLYKLRHLVENFFARIKEWKGIDTRYEKLKRNYAAMIELGCAYLWSKI